MNPRRAALAALGTLAALGLCAGQPVWGAAHWPFSWARQAAVAAAIGIAAWGLGRRVLARLAPSVARGDSAAGATFGLGLGVLAAAVLALGLAGALHPLPLTLLLAGGALVGLRDLWPRLHGWITSHGRPGTRHRGLEMLLLGLPVVAGFLYASVPPAFYDALVYHLGLPNRYLAEGALVYPQSFSLAGYPQNAELLFTLALGTGGEVAARLTGFLCTVLAAFTLRGWIAGRFGRAAANLAYVLLVSQWFFLFQALFLKVDGIGALFLIAALTTALDARREDGLAPWGVAGLLAGRPSA